MCGIAGFWKQYADKNTDWLDEIVSTMANTLIHRGPDDSGTWIDPDAGIAFGHRRLAIIDVSKAGHQPMISADGRFIITYNGEIYNFQKLRQQLEKKGHRFRGHSDTEVMLASFVHWGVESCVKKFNGMFAFALWDRQNRQLWLARDRIGEKPLYYGVQNGTFFFASELKAIRAHPDFRPTINRDALASFLRFSYVPAPYSIYEGIKKLLPGHMLCFKSPLSESNPQSYWSLEEVMHASNRDPFSGSEDEAVDELEEMLKQTVKSRMISDVPLGAFLSGGVDSSTVVALMQSQSDRPVNTFTVGFREIEFNEAVHAKKVARHLGTNHTELYVSPQDAMDVIPKLSEMYDEPFADSSQIPTHLISALARQHVTVALSGDGGDELFAGYNRYLHAQKRWKLIESIPIELRKVISGMLMSIPVNTVEKIYEKIQFFIPSRSRIPLFSEKFQKAAQTISVSDQIQLYKRLVSIIYMPERYLCSGTEYTSFIDDESLRKESSEFVSIMQKLDLMTYLPDDLLAKVDRASMAVSLETRVPFLDHDIIEFVMGLPLEFKVKNTNTKRLLRKVLYRYVPKELIERPKMGFTIPLGQWLRDPLKDWAQDLIEPDYLKKSGYFRSDEVLQMWDEHLKRRTNWGHQLWNILMFQSWLESNI
jgi:asparagine synthase (glutamine-hydrolysing)